jgi:hypothetical protein
MTDRRSILLDTNVLLLFIVGATERGMIRRHKRTGAFIEEDYDLLCRVLEGFPEVRVTPNILTEVSNLAAQTPDPGRTAVLRTLAAIIGRVTENGVSSATAASRPAFVRFGLADTATMEVAGTVDCILTDDLALYLALVEGGHQAFNFNHLRQYGWKWD